MTELAAYIAAGLNRMANALGRLLAVPIETLPGWLSITIIAGVTGIVLLLIFKHTSNQTAIGRIKNAIKADLLTLKLFKDSFAVTLKAQGRLFASAFKLLAHSLVPLLVMAPPVCLLLGQLNLWYQHRPLAPGEQTMVTVRLKSTAQELPAVALESNPAAVVVTGPVTIFTKGEISWKIQAAEPGLHKMQFRLDDKEVTKQLAVGTGFMRINPKRPGLQWTDILSNPAEKPLGGDCCIQSVSIDYPPRPGWICGADWWLVYFFAASIVFAMVFKPLLKVNI